MRPAIKRLNPLTDNSNRFSDHIPDTQKLNSLFNLWHSTKRNPLSNAFHQRFGQWIYNNYEVTGQPWPELFYETNADKAYELVLSSIYGHHHKAV